MSMGARVLLFFGVVALLVVLARQGAGHEDNRHDRCTAYGHRHHQTTTWTGEPPRCYVHGREVKV